MIINDISHNKSHYSHENNKFFAYKNKTPLREIGKPKLNDLTKVSKIPIKINNPINNSTELKNKNQFDIGRKFSVLQINAYVPPNPIKHNVVGGKMIKKIDEKSKDGNGIIQADPLKKIYIANPNKNLFDQENPVKIISNSNANTSIDKILQSTKNSKKIEFNNKDNIYLDNFTENSNYNSNHLLDVISVHEKKDVLNILDKIEDKARINEKLIYKVAKRDSAQFLPTQTDESLKVFPKHEDNKNENMNKDEIKDEEKNPIEKKKENESKKLNDRELEESNENLTNYKESPSPISKMKSNLVGESPRFVKRPSSKREIIDARPKEENVIDFYKGNNINDISQEYKLYYQKISDGHKITFAIKEEIESYIQGIHPKIITWKKNNELSGLLIYHYDNSSSSSNCLRIIITHISFICDEKDYTQLQTILINFKSFLVERVMFQEAHCSLHYHVKENNFVLDKSIQDIFKTVLMFRWLKLENTTKERILILYLKNPNAESIPVVKYFKKSIYTLKIKYNSNFQISRMDDTYQTNDVCKEVNCFPVLFSIFDLVTSDNSYYINFKGFKPNRFPVLRKNCSQFLSFCSDSISNVYSNLITKQIDDFKEEDLEIFESQKVFSSLIDVNSKFDNITSCVYKVENKSYLYNLIEVESMDVLAHKDDPSQIFYLIRLNDKNALFISELDRDAYLNDANLCHYFYKIYSKLEPIKTQPFNKILIPAFEILTRNKYYCPNVLPQLTIEKDLENYGISQFYEYSKISMDFDTEYDYSIQKTLALDETYIIQNNFILGILNYDILSELNIPTSFITYVSKDNWQEKI